MSKENKIMIEKVIISTHCKEFAYHPERKDEKIHIENKLKEFKKQNMIVGEVLTKKYSFEVTIKVHYYSGTVFFKPVKEGGSSIKMDIKLGKGAINSISAMCLDSVCGICEKQTKAFQDTFVNFVGDNKESIAEESKKIEKGLIARGMDKILTLKESKKGSNE